MNTQQEQQQIGSIMGCFVIINIVFSFVVVALRCVQVGRLDHDRSKQRIMLDDEDDVSTQS